MKIKKILHIGALAAASIASTTASAAQWSDTSIGYRYGTQFREPYNSKDIAKSIVNLQHVSGYKYGSNFFNLDLLFSDKNDPIAPGSTDGAQEAYFVYRNTLDLSAVTGKDLKLGIIKSFGISSGFDWNSKNDAGYNSSKRMLVLGPMMMFDVPGFFNVGLVSYWESNAPYNKYTHTQTSRYNYATHPALEASWGIPFKIGSVPLSFEGYFNYIASKGKDEFGNATKPETHFDGQIMYDVSPLVGASKKTFRVGLEYEYWRNKFGDDNQNPALQGGGEASTPMVRAEYHF